MIINFRGEFSSAGARKNILMSVSRTQCVIINRTCKSFENRSRGTVVMQWSKGILKRNFTLSRAIIHGYEFSFNAIFLS